MQKNLREKKKVKRKNLILQEFGRLLILHGLDGFTMKDVSSNLEISLRTLYNYYLSKNDLVVDYLSEMLISILEKRKDKDLPCSSDFAADVYGLLASFFDLPFSEEQLRRTLESYFIGSSYSREKMKRCSKVDQLCIELVCKIIENHKENLTNSSCIVAEIFYTLFTFSFFKFVKGEKSILEAQKELKEKIEIVCKGVIRL